MPSAELTSQLEEVELDEGVKIACRDDESNRDDSFAVKWSRAIENIRQPINRVLLKITRHAATHPKSYVVGVLGFSVAVLVLGLVTNFNVDVDEDVLWTPRNSRSLSHGKWIDDDSGFPTKPRSFNFVVHTNGEDVLGQEGVRRVFLALDELRSTVGYNTICAESHTRDEQGIPFCKITGATRFWNHTMFIFQTQVSSDQDAIDTISQETYPDDTPVDRLDILGNAEDDNGTLTSAQSYMIRVALPETDEAEDFEEVAIDRLLILKDDWEAEAGNAFRVEVFAERSFSDEFTRAIVNDIPLVPIVFVVMSIFTCIVFFKKDKVQSRTLLGFGAVVSVLSSLMTGYGLLFLCGVPFTSMSQILPFVIFGVGLDDSFIITGSYFRTDTKKSTVDRIQDTIEDVGMSITLTTLTSALAFGLGCISSIPAVFWLCLYAFPTIVIDYLYQITFFVALIVIDEKRVQENRRDCCICKTVPRDEDGEQDEDQGEPADRPEPNVHFTDKFMGRYADFLLHRWVKVVVIAVFAALFGACLWSATQLTQEFEFTDVVPKGSYVTDFWNAFDDYSARGGVSPNAYFRYVNQSDPEIQRQMESYINDIVGLEEVPHQPNFFWLRDFNAFVASDTYFGNLTFNEQLDLFLDDPVYADLYLDHIWRDDDGNIIASSCYFSMDNVDQEDVEDQINALENQREITRAQPVNKGSKEWSFFTFEGTYYIWEFYSVAADELILTTILGVVAVSALGFLFIPHWSAVLFVAPMIAILYVDLLGLLQFWGVHINAVSYISLVMAIGLLVDFIMHGLLRYYEASGDRYEKTKDMLQTMGSSILIGGMSTFLGVIPLAFSTSEIFSTIFLTFMALVLLGISHGLMLLPVVLSIMGTKDCIREDKAAGSAAGETDIAVTSHPSDISDV